MVSKKDHGGKGGGSKVGLTSLKGKKKGFLLREEKERPHRGTHHHVWEEGLKGEKVEERLSKGV